MALDKIADKVIETDVLVIGGGMAGCPVAAKAAEHGLNVTLVEKAKTDRSGCGAQGMDHLIGFLRDGITALDYIKRIQERNTLLNGEGQWVDMNLAYKLVTHGFWGLEEMEKLGLPTKWDTGDYYWMPCHWYSGAKVMLRVHWQNSKPIMAAAVRKRGVNVLDRTMLVDLLTNKGVVVGATTVNIRTGEFTVIKAKAVVIAAGDLARCFDPELPAFWKYKFRYHGPPSSMAGDGYAIAYRAGAELASMEITGWNHRTRDDLTLPFGNVDHADGIRGKWFTWAGEEIPFTTAKSYDEVEKEGRDPMYCSIEHFPDDYHKRVEVAIADERMLSFKIGEERGFNPRTHRYELGENRPLHFPIMPGVTIDEDFRALLKGLYTIGDAAAGMGSCNSAIISGFLLGNSLTNFVSEAKEPIVEENQVESQKQVALAPLAVKDGTEPMELECAIRYIGGRYVGQFKSEGRLREGLRRLSSLRREFLPKLMAKNPHYLMRCLEVRNLMDLAELHMQACLERKETRGNFIRRDYPQRDPSLDNMLTYQRIKDGKPVLERRKLPDLKTEYVKGAK